jgi:hypothetical protein
VIGFEVARPASHHVKKTLPPTLSGFPGEAEIRYFVKVTVNRKSFFKENPRAFAPFNFFPIEPPRPRPTGSEIFARQKHQFKVFDEPEPIGGKSKLKELFSRKGSDALAAAGEPPFVSVDIRLPQPAILTCNSDIPLRIVLQKLNASQDNIHLSSLEIALIGVTKIRAHDFVRRERNSWVIMSRSNIGLLVGLGTESSDQEIVIDDSFWRGLTLPNTVAPTFDTCNITRTYELDVRIGLTYSGHAPPTASTKVRLLHKAAPKRIVREKTNRRVHLPCMQISDTKLTSLSLPISLNSSSSPSASTSKSSPASPRPPKSSHVWPQPKPPTPAKRPSPPPAAAAAVTPTTNALTANPCRRQQHRPQQQQPPPPPPAQPSRTSSKWKPVGTRASG